MGGGGGEGEEGEECCCCAGCAGGVAGGGVGGGEGGGDVVDLWFDEGEEEEDGAGEGEGAGSSAMAPRAALVLREMSRPVCAYWRTVCEGANWGGREKWSRNVMRCS